MRTRRLISAVVLFATFASSSRAAPVNLVEVVNFDCPMCRSISGQTAQIRQAIEASGGEYRIAAFPTDEQSMAREIAYYEAREIGLEQTAREAFFAAQGSVYFTTHAQAVEWLQQHHDKEIDKSALNRVSPRARDAMRRTAQLIQKSGANGFPAFIFISDDGKLDVFYPGDSESLLTNLLSEINRRTHLHESH